MALSGCPVLEQLKPMARFHLPFASVEETIYRAASMYLAIMLQEPTQDNVDPLESLFEPYLRPEPKGG